MDFTSHSDTDRDRMYRAIGVDSIDDLIRRVIPDRFRIEGTINLPEGVSEAALVKEFDALAAQSRPAGDGKCFLGGGAYDHYIPAAVAHIVGRPEFTTAYTPYQAEVSQGTLQAIYEFQTMVCRLMGMEVANASHYEGASALAEGVILAVKKTRRPVVVLPYGLNPAYRQVVETYCRPAGLEIRTAAVREGVIDVERSAQHLEGAGAVVVQQPNFFGLIEPARKAAAAAHDAGAMVVASTNPISLALLEPPGEWGADIATADGQPLGVPLSLGGPYVGLFAVKRELVRMIPGRLVARTSDRDGRDGYVLTLQTREQHIRREKATSNICTNQALIALTALVYLSLLGADGLCRVAENSYRGAHYLAKRVAGIRGCEISLAGEFFNEFVLTLPKPAHEVQKHLARLGIFIGPPLGRWFPDMENCILVAVTEKRTRAELDELADALGELSG